MRELHFPLILEALKAIFEIRHVTASLVNRPSTFDVVLLREPWQIECRKDVSLACDNCAHPVIRATDVLSIRDALVSLGGFPNWLSPRIVSDRTACDLIHARFGRASA